jgi:hypothetical protein
MLPELPPEENRPGVPIAPPLLLVLPILASLALEWFVPTSFVHGAFRWTLGLAILVNSAWMLLAVPIGLVLVDCIVITGEERYLERNFGEGYLNYKRRIRRWL